MFLFLEKQIEDSYKFKNRWNCKRCVKIELDKNPNADGYIIEQNKDGKWVRIAKTSTNSVITYRVEKLRPDTTYQFRVQAYDFDGSIPIYSVYQYISGKTAK